MRGPLEKKFHFWWGCCDKFGFFQKLLCMVNAFVLQDHSSRRSRSPYSVFLACFWRQTSSTTPLGAVRWAVYRCMLQALYRTGGGRQGHGLGCRIWSWNVNWHCRVRNRNCRYRGSDGWGWQVESWATALNSTCACWAACRRKAGAWAAHGLAAREARWELDSCETKQGQIIDGLEIWSGRRN